jgi:hypothetical protein
MKCKKHLTSEKVYLCCDEEVKKNRKRQSIEDNTSESTINRQSSAA